MLPVFKIKKHPSFFTKGLIAAVGLEPTIPLTVQTAAARSFYQLKVCIHKATDRFSIPTRQNLNLVEPEKCQIKKRSYATIITLRIKPVKSYSFVSSFASKAGIWMIGIPSPWTVGSLPSHAAIHCACISSGVRVSIFSLLASAVAVA